MLFRGYLPIMGGWQMAQFFNNSKIRFRELKGFLLQHTERVIQHAIDVAKQEGRPFRYLQEKIRKEELAKEIAARDQIQDGLSCVFSVLEPAARFHPKSVCAFLSPPCRCSISDEKALVLSWYSFAARFFLGP